jgi:hypothetical protein
VKSLVSCCIDEAGVSGYIITHLGGPWLVLFRGRSVCYLVPPPGRDCSLAFFPLGDAGGLEWSKELRCSKHSNRVEFPWLKQARGDLGL